MLKHYEIKSTVILTVLEAWQREEDRWERRLVPAEALA